MIENELNTQLEPKKAKKRRVSKKIIKQLIEKQKGKCALTEVDLIFDKKFGTSRKGKGNGCHALYVAIDHKSPKDKYKENIEIDDIQLICYAINDMKGHLPKKLFEIIRNSEQWKLFVEGWQKLKENESNSITYYEYIKNFDNF